MASALEPLDLLLDTPGLPYEEMPAELERLYGGGLGLPADCVYANFVATLDGVVAVPGIPRSNELVAADSDADRFVMGLLRASADAVLIAAGVLRASPQGTWRPERIHPPSAEAYAELRARRGLPPAPEVAILTGQGSIDPGHPVLAAGALVLTSSVGAKSLSGRLPGAATMEVIGESPSLPGSVVVDALRSRGHRRILCEAGPHAFGSLLAADAVDELFLTTSPLVIGDARPGSRLRLVEAADLVPSLVHARLLSSRRHDSHVFQRYALTRDGR